MNSGNIAIIGGTGFEQLPPEIFAEPVDVTTPSGSVRVLSLSNNYTEPGKLFFLSRHGADHSLAPHQIDYRAITTAMIELGVTYILATNAVGSLRLDLPPGSLVLLDDFIDFTRHRAVTFSLTSTGWKHTDFSSPYSPKLRKILLQAASNLDLPMVTTGTYLCCDGPRFETPAEIRMFARWGADVVGMTGLPEAIFAREAGIAYAAVAVVTNYGAGLTSELIDHAQVTAAMATMISQVRELLIVAAGYIYNPL
jgi:5'-methylthioadenosine phosphorylase